MNLYVTTQEIKDYYGISGSSEDARLAMFNQQATAWLNEYLGVSDLSLHKVTEEVHDSLGSRFKLNDVHIVQLGTIMDGETEYTQDDPYDIVRHPNGLDYSFNTENLFYGGARSVKVTYAAGWNASGMVYIDVLDYTGLAGESITINAVAYTEGSEWDAETSEEVTASNIASALTNATTRAFAVGSRVYVIDKTVGRVTLTASVSDSTDMTLSGATLDGVDFPVTLKMAIFTLVGSYRQMAANVRVKSYTIGTKTVSFDTEDKAKTFKAMLGAYKRPIAIAI